MKLSERQTYILLELARGQSKKMIALNLGVSRESVERMIMRLRKRVNCSNVTHLISFVLVNNDSFYNLYQLVLSGSTYTIENGILVLRRTKK